MDVTMTMRGYIITGNKLSDDLKAALVLFEASEGTKAAWGLMGRTCWKSMCKALNDGRTPGKGEWIVWEGVWWTGSERIAPSILYLGNVPPKSPHFLGVGVLELFVPEGEDCEQITEADRQTARFVADTAATATDPARD